MRALRLSLCLLLAAPVALAAAPAEAQLCSDGSGANVVVSGSTTAILNRYYPAPLASTTVAAGATSIPVDDAAAIGDPTAIDAGDLLLIVQVQGAFIDDGDDDEVDGDYGDGPGGDDRAGFVAAGFTAGRYEYARAAGPVAAGAVPLTAPLANAYANDDAVFDNGDDTGRGVLRYQVVRVPQLATLNVVGTLTGEAWDGRAGGIVAADVSGALNIAAAGLVTADGLGFRGGSPIIPTVDDDVQDAIRGEGVAGTPGRVYSRLGSVSLRTPSGLFGGDTGQGAPGNAGGVPLTFDSGGGGGGGVGSGGEGAIGPGGTDARSAPNRALGGAGIDDVERLVLGGGGGSGSLDDPTVVEAVSGQAGGGVVILRAATTSGGGIVSADGDSAGAQATEGSGGGGGGGNVVIVTRSRRLGWTLRASGGTGASTETNFDAGGGGGGGGRVLVAHPNGTPVAFTAVVDGGGGGTAPQTTPAPSRVGDDGENGVGALAASLPAGQLCPDPDADEDGVPDFIDEDDDNDGVPDLVEGGGLFVDDGGVPLDPSADSDGDGIPNYADRDYYVDVLGMGALCPDAGGDGRCDELSPSVDVDGDGQPNHLDRDADGDGLTDVLESGGADADADGRPDACVSTDVRGRCADAAGVPIPDVTLVNTDGDMAPDYLDPDSDGDGLLDSLEAYDGNGDGTLGPTEVAAAGADADGDGIDDAFDPDCAGMPPGCAVSGQPTLAPSFRDADRDGRPNWLEVCGDAYVTGAEPCDAGGASATCTALCTLPDGQDCVGDDQCEGGICNDATMTCEVCEATDADPDPGCEAAAPVCVEDDGPARCAFCVDSAANAGVDDGCTAAAPLCNEAAERCDVCLPSGGDGPDLGCADPTPTCDTSGDESRCVECVTSGECPGFETCDAEQTCGPPDGDRDGVPDDLDTDDDGDGIPDVVEGGGVDPSLDDDGDGVPNYADPDAITCDDGDEDGVCDVLPVSVDFDGDGVPNHLDLDADADGIPDSVEGHDLDGDGVPDVLPPAMLVDADMDGLDAAYDPDEGGIAAPTPDRDGDGRPDYLDGDSDDDGIPDRTEAWDGNGDGRPDVVPSGIDANGDGLDDAFDPEQGGAPLIAPDADSDGSPDYLDVDADGDGLPDWFECPDPTACLDTDGDGVADHRDLDADGDGVPDATEGFDADGDGEPDIVPSGVDADMDGLDDAVDFDSGGTAAPRPDSDGDGIVDVRDVDDDGDGVATALECQTAGACPDGDGDGRPDYLDTDDTPADSDGDGIPDLEECAGDIATCADSDGDGNPDHLDEDDDGDGVPTALECPTGAAGCDTDRDGRPDHLDIDADGDGVTDDAECETLPCVDTDGDGVPDRVDLDSDGDGRLDFVEGHDADSDGVPDVIAVGVDSDGDGLDDAFDPDDGGTTAPRPDLDGDGTPDLRDVDDDDDGVVTRLECIEGPCPDANRDGTPDYLDDAATPIDTDEDGIPDALECGPGGDPVTNPAGCRDSDGDGDPDFDDPDDDNDGRSTASEATDGDPTRQDTDFDGIPDYLDPDDDGDGRPTEEECDPSLDMCPDTDGDGTPDHLDVCGDGVRTAWDAVTVWEECDDGNAVGGDGCSPFCRLELGPELDRDRDSLPDLDECPPPGNPAMPETCPDTDGDGDPNFDDPDDDNDGIPTIDEVMDSADLDPPNTDVDGDGNLNWLDADADADGIADGDERDDADGNGVPDYLEASDTRPGGVAGGALCTVQGPGRSPGPLFGVLLLAAFALLRRRR